MSSYNCQACSKPMVEWVEVCVDCASKLEEPAPSASANTGSPKLADEVLEAIRCVNRGDYESCINVLSGVVGQLRASA